METKLSMNNEIYVKKEDGTFELVEIVPTEAPAQEEISDKERIEQLEAKIELLLKNM